jgi:hypothetical protein
MKVEGLLDTFTRLENPNFAGLAASVGFKGWRVERDEDLSKRPSPPTWLTRVPLCWTSMSTAWSW